MTIKIRKGIMYRVEEGIEFEIGGFFDSASDEDEKTVECGAEIIPIVQNFIQEINSGKFKPRKVVKELEDILKKYEIKPEHNHS